MCFHETAPSSSSAAVAGAAVRRCSSCSGSASARCSIWPAACWPGGLMTCRSRSSMMTAIGPLGIGALIGLVLGLLGGGGAILAVPGLVYVLGADPHAAIAASLAIVAVGAATGLLAHARRGRVAWVTALQLGLTGAVGAWAGASAGRLV